MGGCTDLFPSIINSRSHNAHSNRHRVNSLAGLRGIVEMTHTEVPTDPTHPLAMARSLAQKGSVDRGLLLVGEEDTLSPSSAARELADAAGWEFRSIAGAAHAVPIEQAVLWRRAVLEFLDRSE